ncbi:MAG: hypothetical protein DRI26_00045 [Chloroflexi bacterium]|nr:MAG: hypothetical protein DRI26_00045 [Chloroflexota bacterium]
MGSCTDILDSTSSSSLLKIAPWLSGFSYRKRLIINGSNGAGTGYQIKLKIGSSSGGDFHLNGHCSDFPNDIRFTKDDGLTLLKYWIEDPSEDPITVWVKIDDNLDSNKEIYCYYGSSIASSLSDGEETFEFFDDFLGTPYQVSFANISTNTYGNGIYPPQYPQAIYVPSQNKTYIIFQTRYVGRHIIEYDHSTKTFQNETDIGGHTLWGENQPGHGAPALGIDGDGYLYVFYGSHGGPQYYKKSTNPYDITSWGSEQTLVSAATYPQVFWTDNKLWVFYRNGPQEWVYKTTSDGGSTWSNEVEITDFDSQPNFWGVYARTMKAPNGDIHIVWLWRNDANDYFNLYYAYYDISEGKWKKRDGTELTLPISESEADKVFDGSHTWIWGLDIDENNEPYIFWAYSGDNKLKLTKWKNSAWHTYNITDYPFYKSGSFGALKVDDSSNLRVIADSSDHKTAKLYKSTDGGETWQFVKIVSEELPGMEYGPGSGAGFQSVFNANSELEFLLGPGDNPQDNGICGAWGQDSDFTHNEYIYDLSNKWNINKNPEVENGILTCTGEDNEAVHSKTTFLYKALKVRAKVTHGGSDDAGNVGFATDLNGGNLNAERFWVVTPTRTKVCSGNAENQECTDITSYNAAWHIWEVLWKEGEAKFIVDDNLEATHSTYVCEQAIPIMFQSYRPDATTEVDWVFVRKYVSPEPSFSGAQAEEGPVFTCGDTLANSVASSVHRDIFPTCLETLSCQDTLFSLLSSICRSQDSLGLMDSSVSLAVLLLNAIDSIDVSDGCTLSLSFSSSCLDVLHAIDSASYPLPNVVSCLDSLGTQDSFSSLLSMLCQSKDNIGGADGETSQLSVERALLDILAFQDTSSYLAGIIASASDVLNVQDLNSIRLTFSCSSIDIIKNVDSGGINVTFHLSGDDILKGADYVSGNLQVLLDSLSVFKNTDQSASSLLGFILRSASDVLDMYDLNTATLQISSSSIDLFRTEDNSSINITFHLNSADVFKNSDSAILNLQALLSALEALEISDSSASSLFAEILASASDLLSASDYNEIRLEFLNSSIDVIKSEDGVTPNFTLHLNSSDILHGLDSVTAKLEAILHAMSEFKSTDESSTRKKVVLVTPVKIFKAQQKILIFKAENI